jgi:hypothetical protein
MERETVEDVLIKENSNLYLYREQSHKYEHLDDQYWPLRCIAFIWLVRVEHRFGVFGC